MIRHNKFGTLILSICCVQHLFWSFLILASPDVTHNVAIRVVTNLVGGSVWLTALAFGIAGFLSLLAILRQYEGLKGAAFSAPQQFIMMAGAIALVQAIVTRNMSVPIPAEDSIEFLIAGQVPAILLICGHTLAVVGRYAVPMRAVE